MLCHFGEETVDHCRCRSLSVSLSPLVSVACVKAWARTLSMALPERLLTRSVRAVVVPAVIESGTPVRTVVRPGSATQSWFSFSSSRALASASSAAVFASRASARAFCTRE